MLGKQIMQPSPPKMTRSQAKLFWKSLTTQQKEDFNKMLAKLENKELMLNFVGIDDNEQIQHIVLEPKDKPSQPIVPFAKHFILD